MLKDLYLDLGIKKTPKAPDILNYQEANRIKKTIGGKTVDGFVLIREKLVLG